MLNFYNWSIGNPVINICKLSTDNPYRFSTRFAVLKMAGLLHLYRLSTDVAVIKMYSLNIYKLYTAVLKPCSAIH